MGKPIYTNPTYLSLKKKHEFEKDKAERYEQGYNLLLKYWNDIPNDNKQEVNKQLAQLKL